MADVWGGSWADSWTGWAQSTAAPVVVEEIIDGAGSGQYRFEDDELAQWLLAYFPPKAVAPDEDDEPEKENPKPILLAEVEPYVADILALDRVDSLFAESKRLTKRASTAVAARKLRQVERERNAIKHELNELVTRIVRRKRRDEEAALNILMRFL